MSRGRRRLASVRRCGRPGRWLAIVAVLAMLSSGCELVESIVAPAPQLNGVWGGIMSYQGRDEFVYALDLRTSSSGSVSGSGLWVVASTNVRVPVTVAGSIRGGSVSLRLTDRVNDSISLSGRMSQSVVRGNWTFARLRMTGSFRMAAEQNIGLLSSDPRLFAFQHDDPSVSSDERAMGFAEALANRTP